MAYSRDLQPTYKGVIVHLLTLRIQVCPKISGFPLRSYSRDAMFRPSILLDREGSGSLG